MISASLAILETDEQRNKLAEFYRKYKNRLYAIAYSKLNNKQDAEDAVMETFSRIADKPQKFFRLRNDEQKIMADVIVRNVSVDMYKHANKIETVELSDNIVYDDSENPTEEQLLFKFDKTVLMEFIAQLPPMQRDIMYLRAVHKMEIKEIAKELSVSENVVRQRLYHARQAIQKRLEKEEILK